MYCKLCSVESESKDKGLCELCADRLREEKGELKSEREITQTEEIFGSEGAYRYYKEGRYYGD